jgi:hypothetical protein
MNSNELITRIILPTASSKFQTCAAKSITKDAGFQD